MRKIEFYTLVLSVGHRTFSDKKNFILALTVYSARTLQFMAMELADSKVIYQRRGIRNEKLGCTQIVPQRLQILTSFVCVNACAGLRFDSFLLKGASSICIPFESMKSIHYSCAVL